MGTAVSTCTLDQRSNLILPTCHLHSLCVDAPEKGPKRAARGGSLLVLGAARAPYGPLQGLAPCLCLCQLPELPLPLQFLLVSLLSSQPLSWGLGLQEQGQGVHTGTLGAHSLDYPQNH